ncbi:hypothetical protein [Cupriavidus campinensis]
MTLGYRPISGLAVRHPYFVAGWPAALQLQPDAPTAALMSRFDLLLRGEPRRFVVMANTRLLDRLWSARDEWPADGLSFAAHSADPLWAYYTDVRALATSGAFRVAFPLAPRDCPGQADWLAAAPLDHAVDLPVRRTFWKYLLVGDWGADDALGVADAAGAVPFGDPAPETLPDGATVTAIRSTVPLALEERPRHRFQLRRGSGADARVLMARLPVAGPAALRREVIGGALCDVSEIFVNR